MRTPQGRFPSPAGWLALALVSGTLAGLGWWTVDAGDGRFSEGRARAAAPALQSAPTGQHGTPAAASQPDPQAAAEPSREPELTGLLLAPDSVPPGLVLEDRRTLPNTAAAAFFADAAAAERAMVAAGRVSGATVDYRRHTPPHPDERVSALASSVAVYRTDAAADAVLTDDALVRVLHGLGLDVTEVAGAPVGERSRVFHGRRAGDAAPLAALVVVFRQGNTLGTVTVVAPAPPEQLSAAAVALARRQAAAPIPLTLTPAHLTA